MKRTKFRPIGCGVLLLAVLLLLMFLAYGCRAAQQINRPEPEATAQEIPRFFKSEYFDRSESLYRYHDPENGISSIVGIDVSQHQGTLDWNFWKESGLDFVFIRAGFRGYGTGAIVEDSCYRTNLEGAKAAGFRCGVYFYSQAINAEEAREEADYVLSLLGGTELEMPIVYDWELPDDPEARTLNLPEETLQENAVAFCEEIRAAGYTPMLYANAAHYAVYRAEPQLDDTDIWYAQYTDDETYADDYSIWQYTQTGTVNGSLSIDLNLAFLNSEGELLSSSEIAQMRP